MEKFKSQNPNSAQPNSKANRINHEKDIATFTIKPEPLADGRGDKIMGWLNHFCSRNSLKIVFDRCFTFTEEHINSHYLSYKNKLEEIGNKVLASYALCKDEKKRREFEVRGFTKMSPKELGTEIYKTELHNYPGKKFRFMVITGKNAAEKIANVRGASDPVASAKGTLRHEFITEERMGIIDILLKGKPLDNIVHVSIGLEELDKELQLHLGLTLKEAASILNKNMSLYPGFYRIDNNIKNLKR